MLAPGLSARSRALARLPCASRLAEFLTATPLRSAHAFCQHRARPVTTAIALHDRWPATPSAQIQANDTGISADLHRLRAAISANDLALAVKSYDTVRRRMCPGSLDTETTYEFCRLLRRSAKAAPEETKQKLLRVVLRVVADQQEGVDGRVMAEGMAAHNLLGQPEQALAMWQQEGHWQAGVQAVQAAVAMKDPARVRSVYYRALKAIREANQTPSCRVFQALVYASVRAESVPSGADRRWDAARLGALFLMQAYADARDLVPAASSTHCVLLQYALRAMFQTGQWRRAMQLYNGLSPAHVTSRLVAETVRGLGRNSRMDEACQVLMDAPAELQTAQAWNAYLGAIADQDTCRIRPDAATTTIRMRALLRAGEWRQAIVCFRQLPCPDTVACDDSSAAHRRAWALVHSLVPGKIDARMADTVLKYALSTSHDIQPDVLARILPWALQHTSSDRKTTHAIAVNAFLRAGRLDDALAVHKAMRMRKLWPSRSINCMLTEALANVDLLRAAEFIEMHVPGHHWASCYAVVLKSALQQCDYTYMRLLLRKHYPAVQLSDSRGALPFPTASMYHRALQATHAQGAWEEHRHILAMVRQHQQQAREAFPQLAERLALLVHQYRHALKS
ncbi:hypothetical protein DL89DRAFT_268509 [Linderina pennispora]|uniref:Pentacotripeptide-repeat region of PRORP domain-containing protein n=1 Tax=Linderina pennispora TaxID=61395 RepID=A0A1Y1W5U3_9FUNG|nr:uncharacterized protein DL89DRAFT_268509 [Linderina pennispora]ORX68728.1 hypothetical protein DL89DRAFT_268509 [Linderina pennispora]